MEDEEPTVARGKDKDKDKQQASRHAGGTSGTVWWATRRSRSVTLSIVYVRSTLCVLCVIVLVTLGVYLGRRRQLVTRDCLLPTVRRR